MLYILIWKFNIANILNMLIVSRLICKLHQDPNRFFKLGKHSRTDMEEQEDKKTQDSSKEEKIGNIASLYFRHYGLDGRKDK